MGKIKIALALLVILLIIRSCALGNDNNNIIFTKSIENYGDTGGVFLPLDVNESEIKIMLISETNELSDSLIVKELSQRTGLKITIVNVIESEASRQTQLLISTNALPDIIKTTLTKDEINSLGERGTFVSINKYLNELPNFRKRFIENKETGQALDSYLASDSNLYFYPKFQYRKEITHSFLYRKDIFEKNNLKMWTNNDEFYNTLKALKEIYPDSTPYVSSSGNKIFDEWALSFGIEFPGMFYDRTMGKWKYSGCDLRFKEMIDFLKKLYDEKLIDNSFLNTTPMLWEWKMTGDNSFVTYGKLSFIDDVKNRTQIISSEYELSYANPPGNYYRVKKNSDIDFGPSVTNNKNSLTSLKLLDYLSSPSGIELLTLGLHNKTYEYNENKIVYSGFNKGSYINEEILEKKYGLFIPDLYFSIDKRSPLSDFSDNEKEAINNMNEKGTIIEDYPYVRLSTLERVRAEEIIRALDDKAYQYALNYIRGTEEKPFNEWLSDARKEGLDELEKIYNKER